MHFFSRYSYIWKFNKEQEERYDQFVKSSNITSLQLVTFITIFGMSLFLLIDYFKNVDFSYVLGTRIIVLTGASIIMWLSFRGLSTRGIVYCVIIIVILIFGAALVTATFAGMPSYYLTNLLFLMFLLAVTASGLHLRQAFYVNLFLLITFLLYSNFINRDSFYFSQYPHLFSIFFYIHIVGIVLENRRRKNFMQFNDLARQTQLVDDLNQQKNKVISVLSHDVASPLNSLSALLHMETKGEITAMELRPYFSELREELDNVSFLLNSLVRWSRSQMQGFVLDKTTVNILEVIENKRKLFYPRLVERKIEMPVALDAPVQVTVDEDMLRIAIHNLLSNALKFAREGTKIELEVSKNGQSKMQVLVTNYGAPIPPDLQSKLFTFQMPSMHGANGEQGAGLGLALSAFFIRLNGGDITLRGSDDQSTTFCLELPLDA